MKIDSPQNQSAFTRTDLFAVIFLIGMAAIMALPALAAVARDANSDQCQNNLRQVMRAMHLYAADNSDFFPFMNDMPVDSSQVIWLAHRANVTPDSTNAAKIMNPAYNMIAGYLDRTRNPFKCPSDPTTYVSAPAVRSISMSQAVGSSVGSKTATDGYWLDGVHNHFANQTWRCYGRIADIVNPRPSELFVLIDENPNIINDAAYAGMGPTSNIAAYKWIDYPATYHNNGAGIVFADGHAETKIWQAAPGVNKQPPAGPGYLNDLAWIANHTSALISDQP